jgi:hypothetical protein
MLFGTLGYKKSLSKSSTNHFQKDLPGYWGQYRIDSQNLLRPDISLEKWTHYRQTDWVTYFKYPEFTTKEVNQSLSYKNFLAIGQ